MTRLLFTKMHGAGNDFIIIDNRDQTLSEKEIISLAPELCHRRYGIGADGIIGLQPSGKAAIDYTMFYRNADGSDAGMCGNGARCLALFAAELGMGTELTFNVHDKVYKATVDTEKHFVNVHFPMQVVVKEIILKNEQKLYQLHAGTEHIVKELPAEELANNDKVREEGKMLRYNDQFDPPGTNVNFIKGDSDNEIEIQTYERGVEDLTLACGTGAIAGAVTWHHINQTRKVKQQINVHARGGTLTVRFNYNIEKDSYSNIHLEGGAQFVFEGEYIL